VISAEEFNLGVWLRPLTNLDAPFGAGACTFDYAAFLVYRVPFSGERMHL
jgi:hypothetical protein